MDVLQAAWEQLFLILTSPFRHGLMPFVLKFIPYVLFLELPVYAFILLGVLKYALRKEHDPGPRKPYRPKVLIDVRQATGARQQRQISLPLSLITGIFLLPLYCDR